jgi:hypothetical protein
MARTDPPADPAAAPPEGTDPEADRIKSLDDRFGAIERTQEEQGGMLRAILDKLPGGSGGDGPGAGATPTPAAGSDIQSTVRAEIEAANRRREAEEKARADEGWRKHVDEALEQLKPEATPREPQTGVRGRLQRITFGRME